MSVVSSLKINFDLTRHAVMHHMDLFCLMILTLFINSLKDFLSSYFPTEILLPAELVRKSVSLLSSFKALKSSRSDCPKHYLTKAGQRHSQLTAKMFFKVTVPIALTASGLYAWHSIYSSSLESQKKNSSLIKGIMYHLRHLDSTNKHLGSNITLLKVDGSVNNGILIMLKIQSEGQLI